MSALAAAVARRKAVASSAKRRKAAAVPAAAEPRALMRDYDAALSKIVDALHAEAVAALRDEGVRVDAADGSAPMAPGAPGRVAARLEAMAKRLVEGREMIVPVERIAQGVVAFTRKQWAAQVKAALGIDLTTDPPMAAKIQAFRNENVDLIRSLADDNINRVRLLLNDAGSGERVENIITRLRQLTGASKSRASLIARDQVLRLNGDVTEARHAAAGVTEYIWRTSRDERVRPSHKALDGTRHAYAKPPVVDQRSGRRANPGRDYQCRCVAEPMIPGFDA